MALSNIQEAIENLESAQGLQDLIYGQVAREIKSLDLSDLLPNGPNQPPLIYAYLRLFAINDSQYRRLAAACSSVSRTSGRPSRIGESIKELMVASFDMHMDLRSRHLDILESTGEYHKPVFDAYVDLDAGKITIYEFMSIAKRAAIQAFSYKFQKDRFPNGLTAKDCASPEVQEYVKELASIIVLMDDNRKDTSQEELDRLVAESQEAVLAMSVPSSFDSALSTLEDALRDQLDKDFKKGENDVQDT